MNCLYNGLKGLTHRARIPNEMNINIGSPSIKNRTFTFNAKSGIFQIDSIGPHYRIVHHIYAHRFYNRAIINQVYIYRLNYEGNQITILYRLIKNNIKRLLVLWWKRRFFAFDIRFEMEKLYGSSQCVHLCVSVYNKQILAVTALVIVQILYYYLLYHTDLLMLFAVSNKRLQSFCFNVEK